MSGAVREIEFEPFVCTFSLFVCISHFLLQFSTTMTCLLLSSLFICIYTSCVSLMCCPFQTIAAHGQCFSLFVIFQIVCLSKTQLTKVLFSSLSFVVCQVIYSFWIVFRNDRCSTLTYPLCFLSL